MLENILSISFLVNSGNCYSYSVIKRGRKDQRPKGTWRSVQLVSDWVKILIHRQVGSLPSFTIIIVHCVFSRVDKTSLNLLSSQFYEHPQSAHIKHRLKIWLYILLGKGCLDFMALKLLEFIHMIPCFFLVWYNRYVFKCLNYSDDLVQTFLKKCYVKVGANVISNSAHENKSLLPWL